jgi:hypothetical protein
VDLTGPDALPAPGAEPAKRAEPHRPFEPEDRAPRSAPQPRYVTTRAVVVREGPTGRARKVGSLPRGCELAVVERANAWRYVRPVGAGAAARLPEGWVYLRRLRPLL